MLAALLLAAPLALANGQTSHQWITIEALGELDDGPLAEFLARDDLRDALLNGTMFPDGGYAVGDGYGETAHWEPMQDLYLRWIRQNCAVPWTDSCSQQVAFLLGMRSHGMADQFYDAVYMEHSRDADASAGWGAGDSMDEATDVGMVAEVGPAVVPPPFVPYDPLLGLLADAGNPVDAGTLDDAQGLLGLAIWYVGAAGVNPEAVARYEAQFPWACTHQVDPATAGNPPHEAQIVAAYWELTWARLTAAQDDTPQAVLATYPDRESGGYSRAPAGHAFPLDDVRARVQVVFARGLDPDTVTTSSVQVRRHDDGSEVPVGVNVFYGRASHVVNIAPVAPWDVATAYDVTLDATIRSWDGVEMAAADRFTFTTAPRPAEEAAADTGALAEASGCACAHGPTGDGGASGRAGVWAGALGLLGALRARRRRTGVQGARPPGGALRGETPPQNSTQQGTPS